MPDTLILSIFPGVDLLGRAFEEEWPSACIVRGPDLIFGGDIRTFHPPPGVFDGVLGGPPCQAFSRLVHIVKAKGQTPKPNLIPEYERIVAEAEPSWFLMENVPAAPEPVVDGYVVTSATINNRDFGADQNRERRFSFGTRDGRRLDRALAEDAMASPRPTGWARAVVATSSKEGALAKSQGELAGRVTERMKKRSGVPPGQSPRRTTEECATLQGLPADFLKDAPFTAAGKYQVIGNGVPLPMGRAVARAVKEAIK